MEHHGVFCDVVAGVSIGALNGAIIASHPRNATPALEAFWRELMVDVPDYPAGVADTLRSWQILTYGVLRFFSAALDCAHTHPNCSKNTSISRR
jgi:NTE family protein